MSPRLVSVIVSTYERPDALAAVLAGLAAQSDRTFETIVADDGSGEATRAAVAAAPLDPAPRHVWQPDEGFRAAEARNRALLAARGDYIVFLDGDCVPRPDFIARHRALAEPGWFVAGNRVLLDAATTARVLGAGEVVGTWGAARWIRTRLSGGVNRALPLLALPDGAWRRAAPARWEGARTCNLAAWRADLEAVDGFDCAFQGWGLEDTDLALRLMRAGIKRKDGRFATAVIHLWHPEADRSRLTENRARLDQALASARVRAERGLSMLRSEGAR